MSLKLAGTVALVTGASSGIGHATARTLARLGAAVAVVARREDRLDTLVSDIERAGGKAFAVATDITDRANAEAAVQQTVDHFGRLDILVNNAGVMILGPVLDNEIEDWNRMIALNQRALLYMTKAAGIGQPKAVRAVAGACASNRVALVVPCHRVIRGDGGLGGYRWGLARKRTLIDRERAARGSAV